MAVIILSYFVKAVKGQGDEKTFHTSLCDQKWPDLSLATSTNLGKVCEDFIMNQTMILKILFIISYCLMQAEHKDLTLIFTFAYDWLLYITLLKP